MRGARYCQTMVDCSGVRVLWPMPTCASMSPTMRHVPMDVGPMTNPHTIATTSATTVPAATTATRLLVGGLVNALLPELGVLQRTLHRRRELIHEQTQSWAPARRDAVVESDHFAVFNRDDLRKTGPLGDGRRRHLAADRVSEEDHLGIRAEDVFRAQLRVPGVGRGVLRVGDVDHTE